jgi:di/tricarboxylate transporter
MSLDALLAVAATLASVGILVLTRASAPLVFGGALTFLMLTGVLPAAEAVAGFSNTGMLTVGALFVVATGLRQTGGIQLVGARLFGHSSSVLLAQLRIMLPVMGVSAFLNNTPVVATFLPAVADWARKHRISVSRLMIPLSYAAIVGGTCTLIGTSTNLVVNGLLQRHAGTGFGFFELAWLGVPSAIIALVYVLVFSRWLLPERIPAATEPQNPKEYTVEMLVPPGSALAGKTVQQAGLRHLPGLFLVEIERRQRIIPAVGPDEVLEEGDRLVFAGVTDSVADLQSMHGLVPATDQVFKLDGERSARTLVEAVVAASADFVGKTVRESGFRNRFDAVVIAVSRGGQRISGKIGDIRLRAGDLLLIESDPGFARRHRDSREFLLLRPLGAPAALRHERAWLAWLILGFVVASSTLGLLDILTAAMAGAGLMVLAGCCSGTDARRSIDLDVLIVIACAFGLGEALYITGAAEALALGILSLTGDHPVAVLASIYFCTVLLTECITNNAAAALMFPLAMATAQSQGLDFMPFAVAVTFAASASFATPIGYQTNLMVFGPGGYRFIDYIRFGVPMNLTLGITAVMIIPKVWPLLPG